MTPDSDRTSGEVFLAMQRSPQVGPMIIDGHGQLVWFHPIGLGTGNVFPSDLAVQRYQGQSVLTWWQGQRRGQEQGKGEDVIMNHSYRTVAVVHAGDGYQADFHEFQITPQGTALLDAVDRVKANLTSVGGPRNGTVLDDVIQEVDIKTGKVLWEWRALGHVPLTASYMTYSSQKPFYDYFHLNSIQLLPDGNLLISARHTWSLYEISRKSGKVIWTLGGKYSSFTMGRGTNFEWQHDARLRGQTLSLFDDGSYPQEERQSSAKYLRLNFRARTVSLIHRYIHSPPLLSGAAGSAQTLPDGNVFVGWGEVPVFSEYTPAGKQVFDGSFAFGVTSYRAFRFPWVGQPQTRPALAVSRSRGHTTLYVSWNGATQVRAWQVLGGRSVHGLEALGRSAPRTGFETDIGLTSRDRYFAVQALGQKGKVLGTSRTMATSATSRDRARRRFRDGHPGPNSGLRVIPFPGTPDAAPTSRVIFSALAPSDLRSVTVIGSRSGPHRGRVEALPAHAGTAFVPAHPFAPGETVRVSAGLAASRAGAASGQANARYLRFSFAVSARMSRPATEEAWAAAGLDHLGGETSSSGSGPTQHFHSAPDLRPPQVSVTRDSDHSSGDIFLTPSSSPQAGPMILDSRGRLVWWHSVTTVEASNFQVQRYRGQPVLTWWQGDVPAPGEDVIMSRSYQRVAVVHAGDGYQAELHEFQITPQGTAYLTCFAPAYTNLTSVGGPPNGGVIDGMIQEVDIKTGKVLWEWHALGHVPLNASYTRYSKGTFYDFFHLNSIQQLPNGNLLISARDTWAVYEISRQTGKVIWTLGGKDSNFKMGPGTNFEWQHDARLSGQTLSLLDDAGTPQEERQSSAKLLRVDIQGRRVTLIRRFTHSPPLLTGASGSTQELPNGNLFVGWGAQPQFSEYTASGRQIFNGSFALGVWSYRAFRFPWNGQPHTPPALAVSRRGHRTTLYASWNGATQVRTWQVLGGTSTNGLKRLGRSAPRTSFETDIRLTSRDSYFAVRALDGKGKVLGTSAPTRA